MEEKVVVKWGPFNSEEGGKAIMRLMSEEVFPVKKEIQDLSVEIADYKQGFLNSFYRKRLSELEERYRLVYKRFLNSYRAYQTPDILFKDSNIDPKTDPQKMATVMADYMGSQAAVAPHFVAGFGLFEVMDRTLNRCRQSADQRVTISISVIAILISVSVWLLGSPAHI